MKHALKLLDDHTIILTLPKGTRVDRVLVEEMGKKTGTMYLPEQATFRSLQDLHCVYDMGLITLEQYLNERNRLERGRGNG